MKATVAVLRSLGILIGIWAILALVAWVAGVLPPIGFGGTPAPEADAGAGPQDAGPPRADAAVLPKPPAPDGDDAGAGLARPADAGAQWKPPPGERRARTRWVACDPAVTEPTLRAVGIVGDPRAELAIGCGPLVQILAFGTDRLAPVRVASFDVEPKRGNARVHAAPPAAGDVDGDSIADLVLGFWYERKGGGTHGGALYLVRRNATGAFDEGRKLAPIAAVDVALAQLDGEPGHEILALNAANAFARRPSEVWVFAGGASPVRRTVVKSGVGGRAMAVADLDRDGHLDVVAAATEEPRVDAFFGDGTARLPRSSTWSLADAHEAVAGDLDGDGGVDVLVRAAGLHLLPAGPADAIDPQPIDAPEDIRQVHVLDLDRDGKRDVVGLVGHEVHWARRTDRLTFEQKALVTLPDGMTAHAIELADLDADGTVDLALLVRAGETAPWELVMVPHVRAAGGGPVLLAEQAEAVPDAPLRLQIALR